MTEPAEIQDTALEATLPAGAVNPIRDKAKALGIKSWHVKALDKLEAEIKAVESGEAVVAPAPAAAPAPEEKPKLQPEQFGLTVLHNDGKAITVQDAYGAQASVKASLSVSEFLAAVRSVGVRA